jgi:hypothetical protein
MADLRVAPKVSSMYQTLAELYDGARNPTKAEEMRSKRIALWRHWKSELPKNPYVGHQFEAAVR